MSRYARCTAASKPSFELMQVSIVQVINTGSGLEFHSTQPSVVPTKVFRRTAVTLGRVPRAVAMEMSWYAVFMHVPAVSIA
jgi:hypothetical protein